MKPRTIVRGLLLAGLIGIFGSGGAHALQYPHNSQKSIYCSSCHYSGFYYKVKTKNPPCLETCHRAGATGATSAKRKALTAQYASNIFGNFTNGISAGKKQISHAWSVNQINNAAGATNQLGAKASTFAYGINCTRCHLTHGTSGTYEWFWRYDKRGDGLCLSCHAARQVGQGGVRTYRNTALAGTLHQSHPVEVNYSSARYGKHGYYETTPKMDAGYNESARLRLYTAYNFVNGIRASVKAVNTVICSTCHGFLHAADSNPYTFDNLSASTFGNFSFNTADGYLLRRYNSKKSNDLCTSCHKVQLHQTASMPNQMCSTCHSPHKGPGDNNIYLIRTSIMTPNSGKKSVQFISTSNMAFRWVNQFPGRNAICQVCHTLTPSHANYSTAGVERETAKMGEYLGAGKYRNCIACHPHNMGFPKTSSESCNSCHGTTTTSYPSDTFGKHQKHIGSLAVSYSWTDGSLIDSRSAGAYGFSCGRCHSPFGRYTDSQHHPGVNDNYTTDVGFRHKSILPNNTGAIYNYGATGGIDTTKSSGGKTFRYPGTGTNDGKCSNLYCHGQFYNGYTGFNPTWQGTAACGACHGVTQELGRGLPGNMRQTSNPNYGAHPRHVGGASVQGYGQGAANFRCNACHATSATQNTISSVGLNRSVHVDGRMNIKFDAAYNNGNAKYNNETSYSAAITIKVTRPSYKTCALTYCHSDGSRIPGNYSTSASYNRLAIAYPNWSSSKNFTTTLAGTTTKQRCARCHGADKVIGSTGYKGITSAMPGYGGSASVTRSDGKRNSHWKHVVVNGFMCNACHYDTVNADNRSIKSTTLHVNKSYDVSFSPTYDAGSAQYNPDNTCSGITCHGNRRSAAWGQAGICQDCHFKNTQESAADKGFSDNYQWRNMTSLNSVPKIYSSEWTRFGHGATAQYPNSPNPGANKNCATCHEASGSNSHKTDVTSNPFRLFTAAEHIDDLCQQCHASGKSGATKWVMSHYTTGWGSWGDAKWQFIPKCVDCHDPHGDKNRYMIKTYINYSGSRTNSGEVGKRWYDLNPSAQMTFSTIGGSIGWESYVRSDWKGICQRCHNTQSTMQHFRKYSTAGGDGYDGSHNPGDRCTNCHKHDQGFKGADCDGCHYFPPTASGKHAFHVATSPADGIVNNSTKREYSYGCKKCHTTASHYAGIGNFTTEIGFDTTGYPSNPGSAGYQYGALQAGDPGVSGSDDYTWNTTNGTCKNLYCHGQFFGGYSGNDPQWYGTSSCGKCHGASKNNPPSTGGKSSGAHAKHVTTYSLQCRVCHRGTTGGFNAYTVADRSKHVDGKTNIWLYTTESRVGRSARYGNVGVEYVNVTTNTNPGVVPNYKYCMNTYCHSKGADINGPFGDTPSAFATFTAKWGDTLPSYKQAKGAKAKCNYCHGSKVYTGTTSAMPNYSSTAPKANSHRKHINYLCNTCHGNIIKNNTAITDTTRHANKFYNISIAPAYRDAGLKVYSMVYNGSGGTCMNNKCHGSSKPKWGASTTATCKSCHISNSADIDDNAQNNFPASAAAKIYSTEWVKKGHGVIGSDNVLCTRCHDSDVPHNDVSNPFRLYTSADSLCDDCHADIAKRNKFGFGLPGQLNYTGINTHSQSQTQGDASWNFPQSKAKCIDCHDPHGDKNMKMIHLFINMSGSDNYGRPNPLAAKAQMSYTTWGGQKNWSSFANNNVSYSICRRCHTPETNVGNDGNGRMTKDYYAGDHQAPHQICTNCHSHKSGFKGAGCSGCHGTVASNGAPPKSPDAWTSDKASNWTTVGLHEPHGYNPRNRGTIPAATGYECKKCHGPNENGQSNAHDTSKPNAGMANLTSAGTILSERTKGFSYGSYAGTAKVVDDTCSYTGCHTPRAYSRKWGKPRDCDDCHGFRNTPAKENAGIAAGTYNLITSGSHKMHAYSSASFRYAFACRNCHKYVGNNYSTHYNGFVNITFAQAVGGGSSSTYTRGLTGFKGFTTKNEFGNCNNVYCHGNFSGGNTGNAPKWGGTATCGTCHATNNTLALRHPNHIDNYGYSCRRCHNATAGVNNTVIDQRTHVNGTENVMFNSSTYAAGAMNNTGGTTVGANDNRRCMNIYCHSSGARLTGTSWTTRTTISNYTADWGRSAAQIAGTGKGCSLCHGSKRFGNNFNGITAAMPSYPGQAHGKHAHNVGGDNFKCYVCHANTINAAGAIISYANHINGFKNLSIIATYKSGQTLYSSTVPAKKTCKNVKCHASRMTPAWNTTTAILCQNCHYTTTDPGVTNNEANYKFTKYTSTTAKVYSSEWVTTGHGRASGNYRGSGTAGAGLTCRSCHRTAIAHNYSSTLGGNFGRLTGIGSGRNINDVCLRCHGTTAPNKASGGADMKANHHADTTGLMPKCVDCHDPHGDKNAYMVQRFVNWTVASDSQGRPNVLNNDGSASSTRVKQLAFTTAGATAVWGDYVRNTGVAKDLGICQTCHRPTAQGGTLVRFKKDQASYDASHNNTERCAASCHKHVDKFVPAAGGCDGCHAYPPKIGDGKAYKDAPVNEGKGAHESHVNHLTARLGLTLQPATDQFGTGTPAAVCGVCHTNTVGNHKDSSRLINFGDGSTQYQFGASAPVYNGTVFQSGTTEARRKTCSNVMCHFQKSPGWQNITAIGD